MSLASICSPVRALLGTGHKQCGGTARILVFGGSMTYGVEPMKSVHRTCPGCPAIKDMKPNLDGKVFGESPHCCSWPRFLERWLPKAYPSANVELINLAVPATSSLWLSEHVNHVVRSLDTRLTECDVVLLDYSVNDADARMLYNDNETALVTALERVAAKLRPAVPVLIESYPHARREDRWGKRASPTNSSFRSALFAFCPRQQVILFLW